ncbi:tetratricopeptide repeat protein [Ancylomarina sp. 16SWW S1-10-2]|uniref:tetratricopeptide repeat protein n=1 Tax=Ancylomarina sp. 16SWW S1-10-2 TaxID=2499681 RepID=UPI0012AE26C1|nr:hypothetical protein [Ancylomarina sp. 16SWW S1-10-2]MRT92836.1 hypothetical protein [Ancylomarina sp. 16SWW S1-10-2]
MKTNLLLFKVILFFTLNIFAIETNAQKDVDWSKVYADKYFFSYERSMKSVVIYARRDTMIEVWVNGQKDMGDYSEGRGKRSRPDYFESWDNGVGYLLEMYGDGRLNVKSRDNVGDGLEYQYDAEMEANIFGNIVLYDCSNFSVEKLDTHDIKPYEIFNLNNVAYYLYNLEPDECRECAISILEKIITLAPEVEVLYLNLGDAYLTVNDTNKAKEYYKKYIDLMKKKNKAVRIPVRVDELLKIKTNIE